jgi:hypothetical protein
MAWISLADLVVRAILSKDTSPGSPRFYLTCNVCLHSQSKCWKVATEVLHKWQISSPRPQKYLSCSVKNRAAALIDCLLTPEYRKDHTQPPGPKTE